MSFAGNNKRAAFDYESDLAAYTSTEMSPGRPAKRRAFGPSSNEGQSSPFVTMKLGEFQQLVERLNQQLRDVAASLDPNDVGKTMMMAAEYERILKVIQGLYKQPSGKVLAMGNDDINALGVAVTEDDDKLEEYPPTFTLNIPSNIIQVAAGGTHSVALSEEGEVYTWGNNDDYALGRETTDADLHKAGRVDLAQVVMVAAGDNCSLYLTFDGNVYMTGMYKDIDSGKFANVKPGQKLTNGLCQKDPVKILLPGPVQFIAGGFNACAAILGDGSLYTWGMGHFGELGRSASMGAPLLPSSGNDIPQYDLGKMYIGEIITKMKKDKDGKMAQVEDYKYHTELINQKFLTPARVEWHIPGKYDVLDVAIGELHMVVVARKDGKTRVYSCGHNNYGQLGHGDLIQRHSLFPIEALDGERIAQVSCGSHHTLFLGIMGNNVFACGRSDYGQLGMFDKKEKEAGGFQSTPIQVPFPTELGTTRIASVHAGGNNSAAVSDVGNVYTWGFNETASTGHSSKGGDIERATKLNPMRFYKKYDPTKGTDATVSSVSLGGQHSIMVVKPYL